MTAKDIELALTAPCAPFDRRRYLVVPNVSWGWGLAHEADLICLSANGVASEIEIKVTAADLKRDADKRHGHGSALVKRLWFAGPARMTMALLDYAPPGAGIIAVSESETPHLGQCVVVWPARDRPGVKAVSAHRRYQLARLGCIRYWDARAQIQRMAAEAAGVPS